MLHPDGTVHLYPRAPLTDDIEYDKPDCPGHTLVDPVIDPGVVGVPVMLTVRQVEELDAQPLESLTQIEPPVPAEVTVIDVVPCPAVMVHPVGTDHL